MVTVKAIKNYYDLQLEHSVETGEEFKVSEARAEELSTANNKAGEPLVKIVTTSKKTGKKKAADDE